MTPLPTTEAQLPVVAPLRGGPVLRWAILGPGEIATDFVATLQRHTDQEIVAVGSRSAERARDFASRFSIDAAYGSYADAVTDPRVDIVYVATPNSEHRPLAELAMAAGKHVLIEKPFAVDPADGEQILAAAREAGVFVMEAMWSRFLPQTLVIDRLISGGAIGTICSVYADFGADFSGIPGAPVFDPALGGGALRDIGIYPMWLAHWLLGTPDRLTASGTMSASGVDDQVGMLLDYAGGAQAVLHTTMRATTPTTAVISGTRGRIEINGMFLMPDGFVLYDADGSPTTWTDPAAPRLRDGLAWQATAVAQHIADGLLESPLHPMAAAMEITALLTQAREQVENFQNTS